jgi:RNA polymerase sigma-B factor
MFMRRDGAGRPEERDALVRRFLPLARRLALRFATKAEPFEDVYQVACLGLLKAIDRYDPSRGIAFSTYAVPTITGEIKRYLRDRTWEVHVPRDLLEASIVVRRADEQLAVRLGRRPTVAELSAATGFSEMATIEAKGAARARRALSVEQLAMSGDEDGPALGARIGVPEDGFTRAEHRAFIEQLERCLSARDRKIVRLCFTEGLTQTDVAARLGLSQARVSRMLRDALDRMREAV